MLCQKDGWRGKKKKDDGEGVLLGEEKKKKVSNNLSKSYQDYPRDNRGISDYSTFQRESSTYLQLQLNGVYPDSCRNAWGSQLGKWKTEIS